MSSEDLTSDDESFEPSFVPFKNSRKTENRKKLFDAAPIEQQEFGKFEEYTKGIGSKLLMKMGYKPGQGLGADGSGIVEPIDVKLRPQKMGLGHGGFDERTKSVKKEMEDKMDIDEEEGAYIPSKISKKKAVVYKTAEEIIQEQKRAKIIDMTGKEVREMESFTQEIRHSELPELRYNLKVLGDTYKSRLEVEARALAVEKEKIKKLQADVEKKMYQ